MADDFTEPLKAYKSFLKDRVKQNAIKYFDELTNKSGVDIELNRSTVDKYRTQLLKSKDLAKSASTIKSIWKFFFIVIGIATAFFAIAFIISINTNENQELWGILLAIALIILIIMIVLRVSQNDKIKAKVSGSKHCNEEAESFLTQAAQQMARLNSLYDWNMPAKIINESNDLFHMDQFLDNEKFEYLYLNYGLYYDEEEDVSTVLVQSGDIYGNPFMICKDFRQDWTEKVYEGSIVISWTTTVPTKDGARIVQHTQTLTAQITKPAPAYNYVTYLMYGNEAAPNLTFTRRPTNVAGKSDKEIQKIIKKDVKKLDKRAEIELMDGDPTTNYTRFGNDEFESLYGGTDRDNEVEYRLLFTPLAQKNLLELVKETKPFGDDWYFDKYKMLNYVRSFHSQAFDYSADPEKFLNYSYDDARKIFLDYIESYFEAFYYDLLPIISIPIYQMHKSRKYIYKDVFKSNVPAYEQEVLANSFKLGIFDHPDSSTPSILKVHTENKNGKTDVVKVTAHSFKAIPEVEYVTMVGGDGLPHVIPVNYYTYEPLENETYMAVGNKPSSRNNYNSAKGSEEMERLLHSVGGNGESTYQRGLFAYILRDYYDKADIFGADDIFKNIDNNSNKGSKDPFEAFDDAI